MSDGVLDSVDYVSSKYFVGKGFYVTSLSEYDPISLGTLFNQVGKPSSKTLPILRGSFHNDYLGLPLAEALRILSNQSKALMKGVVDKILAEAKEGLHWLML